MAPVTAVPKYVKKWFEPVTFPRCACGTRSANSAWYEEKVRSAENPISGKAM